MYHSLCLTQLSRPPLGPLGFCCWVPPGTTVAACDGHYCVARRSHDDRWVCQLALENEIHIDPPWDCAHASSESSTERMGQKEARANMWAFGQVRWVKISATRIVLLFYKYTWFTHLSRVWWPRIVGALEIVHSVSVRVCQRFAWLWKAHGIDKRYPVEAWVKERVFLWVVFHLHWYRTL